jgi:hypothetical protein
MEHNYEFMDVVREKKVWMLSYHRVLEMGLERRMVERW